MLSGHAKQREIVIIVAEQIGRSSGSYYSQRGGGVETLFKGKCAPIQVREI